MIDVMLWISNYPLLINQERVLKNFCLDFVKEWHDDLIMIWMVIIGLGSLIAFTQKKSGGPGILMAENWKSTKKVPENRKKIQKVWPETGRSHFGVTESWKKSAESRKRHIFSAESRKQIPYSRPSSKNIFLLHSTMHALRWSEIPGLIIHFKPTLYGISTSNFLW